MCAVGTSCAYLPCLFIAEGWLSTE